MRSVVPVAEGTAGKWLGANVPAGGVAVVDASVDWELRSLAAGVLLVSADCVEVDTGVSAAPADDVLALERAGVSVAVAVARAPRRRPLRDGPFPLPKFKLVIVDAIVKALHLKKRKRCPKM